MKPSGSALLFVGCFLKLLIQFDYWLTGLFIFSVSSLLSLGRLYISGNLSFSSSFAILLIQSCL